MFKLALEKRLHRRNCTAVLFKGLRIKYKNSMHTALGLKVNNIHATNYRNRSRRLAVSVTEITFGMLDPKLSPRFASSMMKQCAEVGVNKICVLRCL